MRRPWFIAERIELVCKDFAYNWQLPERELVGAVNLALDGTQWPSEDEIALAASRECQAKARKRPQPSSQGGHP